MLDRADKLGASDCAPALGLSKWKSPLALYLEKTGELPPDPIENDAIEWGVRLEPVVRQKYAEITGRTVRLPEHTIVHAEHPWMVCHPDGVTDDFRIYEGKTAAFMDGWGEAGSADVPQEYYLQVQHEMIVLSSIMERPIAVADLAVLFAGRTFRLYEIPADLEIQQMILAGEAEFIERIKTKAPPAPDYNARDTKRLLQRMYPGTNGEIMVADDACEAFLATYDKSSELAKLFGTSAECAKAGLQFFMGEASELKFTDGRVLRRKLVQKKAYSVEATSYIDARIVKGKE
jgi:putative phage-type endonuclease